MQLFKLPSVQDWENCLAVTIARWSLANYHRMVAAGLFANRQVELLKEPDPLNQKQNFE
jgi:hypothetical protein